jgi:hypothetical protein
LQFDIEVHSTAVAAEETSFSKEIYEAALAHVMQNEAEAAYRRGDPL